MINWIIEYNHLNTWYAVNNNKYTSYNPEFHMNKNVFPEMEKILKDIEKFYPKHPLIDNKNRITKSMGSSPALLEHLQYISKKELPQDLSIFTQELLKAEKPFTTFTGIIKGQEINEIYQYIPEEYHFWPKILISIITNKTHHIMPPIYHDDSKNNFINEINFYFGSNTLKIDNSHKKMDFELKIWKKLINNILENRSDTILETPKKILTAHEKIDLELISSDIKKTNLYPNDWRIIFAIKSS